MLMTYLWKVGTWIYLRNPNNYVNEPPKSLSRLLKGLWDLNNKLLFTVEMFQLCFSSNKQKSLDIVVYQGFGCFYKYPEPGSNRHSITATGV